MRAPATSPPPTDADGRPLGLHDAPGGLGAGSLPADPSTWPLSAVYSALASTPGGLDEDEAAVRLVQVGPNALEEAAAVPLLRRLAGNFTHLMALLLWAGGALAFAAGLPEIGVAVFLVNVINGLFAFWQEYKAERATEALRKLLPSSVTVLRGGAERRVAAEELVPGDVMVLAEGDRIPADARLVEAHELAADQSTLTGESYPAPRTAAPLPAGDRPPSARTNIVFAGTSVARGRGKAVVFATGMRTEFGGIARLTQGMRIDDSPLQRELGRVSKAVAVLAVGIGIALFVLVQALTPMPFGRGVVFALGIIVAFVPEGMLPTVTLSLAMATQRMARRNALVKRLSAVEALGCTTVICTDKTGTLTQNEMTVRALWLASGAMEVTGVGYGPEGEVRRAGGRPGAAPADVRMLLLAAGLANDARVVAPRADEAGSGRWTVVGDPTEAALRVVAAKAGIDLTGEEQVAPRVLDLPFDSALKRMSTLHRAAGRVVLYSKGAPKELLARCTSIRVDSVDVPLDDEHRRGVLAANDEYSRQGLRVLGVATREIVGSLRGVERGDLESSLVFLGLIAMMDPPRDEVAAAVATCRRAGIRILMMTGDYGLTGESIARRIGLLTGPRVRIVNGDEIDAMDDDELAAVLGGEVLLARTTPAHKLRVVTVLQGAGHVVAVTGDGVNDAPALKRADIGVAMGMAGTDVAREAADMVLLDDNFASIVNAVEEGRTVYADIRKFTSYIFTSNAAEAIPFTLFGLSGARIPLALDVMHVLTVDLGTDLAPALALGAEAPERGLMDRPPRARDEHLITRRLLLRSLVWLGIPEGLVAMTMFYLRFWSAGFGGQWLDLPATGRLYRSATAMALAGVVMAQVGNLFAHRTDRESVFRRGRRPNPLLWIGVATELALVLAVVYVPPLQKVIGTAALPAAAWVPLIAVSPLLMLLDEARKAVVRRRERLGGQR
ncbi:MAG TPA: cation-transporting P-type ATPase [Acidimicrobiales bacterium]|nr:cation-transporting P-type ATPase [Acidimicrobiales bacterium]